MSVDLDWQALDDTLSERLVGILNTFFKETQLPNYLGPVSVQSLQWGDDSPSIELLNITDVSRDFIDLADSEDGSCDSADSIHSISISDESSQHGHGMNAVPSPPSLQLSVRVQYQGNLRMQIKTSLLVNYPSPLFMALPLSMTLTGLALNATFIIVFEGDRRKLHLSIDPKAAVLTPDVSPTSSFYGVTTPLQSNSHWSSNSYNRPRPCDAILQKLQMETEVGQADKHVMRNVTKVEKFILECARSALESEIIWPAFQTIAY